MIQLDTILLEIARERQHEMLYQAETERLYKHLRKKRGTLIRQLVNRLLITARQWSINPPSNPATRIFLMTTDK